MTFQISKPTVSLLSYRLMVLSILLLTVLCAYAQQSQSQLEQQLAGLQRLEAMQPDSIAPKSQQAVLLLSYVCTYPQDSKAQLYVDEAQRLISKIEGLQPKKVADRSDLATLHGFYYTARIVMDPQQNGPRYYRQALDSFDEALKLNPKNEMARQLAERFRQGMGEQAK